MSNPKKYVSLHPSKVRALFGVALTCIFINTIRMIDKTKVAELANEWLKDKEYFLCDLSVTPDDRILVEIDQKDGVWIEDCCALSRFIEEHLDRDAEDFELEVGSAGLGQPFKVRQQYEIHQGDQVECQHQDGHRYCGTLTEVGEEQFTIVCTEKVKAEGEKRPHMEEVAHTMRYSEVAWTKYHIDFK